MIDLKYSFPFKHVVDEGKKTVKTSLKLIIENATSKELMKEKLTIIWSSWLDDDILSEIGVNQMSLYKPGFKLNSFYIILCGYRDLLSLCNSTHSNNKAHSTST